jgi:hypothetical protein
MIDIDPKIGRNDRAVWQRKGVKVIDVTLMIPKN